MKLCDSGARRMEKIEKPFNFSQASDNVAAPKNSSNISRTFSEGNEEFGRRENAGKDGDTKASVRDAEALGQQSELDALGMNSSRRNRMNSPQDGEGSAYSSLKNEVNSVTRRLECKFNNGSIDGRVNVFGQPKTESSSSNSTNFVRPASSNDSFQESGVDARAFNGRNTNNANSSSMSSTCTDLGYSSHEIKVSNRESALFIERKLTQEKVADAPGFMKPSKKRSLELAKVESESFADINLKKVASGVSEGRRDVEEREQSTLSGIDLNEDTTWTNEVEQGKSAFEYVRKPVAIFARREAPSPICESSIPEVGFKGLLKGGWKGSASMTSAFRPTSQFNGSSLSVQKTIRGIDLNVDAAGFDLNGSEEGNPTQGKFSIDLNIASVNDEDFHSSRTVRDFDLNDDPVALDSYIQEGKAPSFRKEAVNAQEAYLLRNAGGEHEPRYVGPMFLPHLTTMPFVLQVPGQAENAGRSFPFYTSASVGPQRPVFSPTSSPNAPLYPAHLNGVPAFHGRATLVEVPSGTDHHSMVNIGPLYNPYYGVNPPGTTSLGGTGMQLLTAAPVHTMIGGQQLNNNSQQGGLLSVARDKRKEPEVRWDSNWGKPSQV